jgi:diguanylate cyclase (GGDEF)-like protein
MRKDSIETLLLVEDNAGDARLLHEMYNEQGAQLAELTHVESMADAEKHLSEFPVDIVVLDLGLPDVQGLDAVRRARAAAPGAALVVVTGLDDEDLAGRALREGAQDYLVKGQIDARGLIRALQFAIKRKTLDDVSIIEKKLMVHSAQHDFLTGLPNRMLLNDRVSQAIAWAPRHRKKVAVLFLDLNGFKVINDSKGHLAGDKLLQSVTKRLVDCVRSSDTVSRQGGDEFVALLAEVEHYEDAAITARRMLDAVAAVHSIDQHEVHVTASIGIAIYPDDGGDAKTLMKNADRAMYHAKKSLNPSYRFFEAAMNSASEQRETFDQGMPGLLN